jgi:hypothetical protein
MEESLPAAPQFLNEIKGEHHLRHVAVEHDASKPALEPGADGPRRLPRPFGNFEIFIATNPIHCKGYCFQTNNLPGLRLLDAPRLAMLSVLLDDL